MKSLGNLIFSLFVLFWLTLMGFYTALVFVAFYGIGWLVDILIADDCINKSGNKRR